MADFDFIFRRQACAADFVSCGTGTDANPAPCASASNVNDCGCSHINCWAAPACLGCTTALCNTGTCIYPGVASTSTYLASTKSSDPTPTAPTTQTSPSINPTSSPGTKKPSTPASTTSPTATSTATIVAQTSSPSTNGLSTGATAGIGIGCAIIGALLGGLIAVILLSRRRRRQQISQPQNIGPDNGGYTRQEKSGVAMTVTTVDRFLPQPTEDDAIVGALSKIRDGIKNHAQNYYHKALVDPKMVDETQAPLVQLAGALDIPTTGISDLLLNPSTRLPMIRIFLAHLILSRCSGQSNGSQSFLPIEVSTLSALYSDDRNITTAQITLFSKWKSISSTLLMQRYSQQPGENDPRRASIENALAAAESILRPFINPSIDLNSRHRNLEGIMRRAAQYAFTMFSQPSSFIFDYSRVAQPDSLVVFPALLVTVNDEAEKLSPPRVLSEKEVVTGLGR